jgi:hypothetical protein
MQAKMSMRLRRVGNWVFYTAEEGKTFYYNDNTGEFQWTSPFEATEQTSQRSNPSTKGNSRKEEQQSNGFANEYTELKTNDGGHLEEQCDDDLPEYVRITAWRPYWDVNSSLIYWYNHDTLISQWESPFEGLVQSANDDAGTDLDNRKMEAEFNTQNQPTKRGNIFDDDDEDDENHSPKHLHDHENISSRHVELKAELKQFHMRNSQRKLRRSKDDYDEPVVTINNENDLDL